MPIGVGDSGAKFFQAMKRNAAPASPTISDMAGVLPFPDRVGGPGGI
ncbi:hypothetical protein [Limnoglobus roseus]|nr:hypothetical protein [Limnoglobus roseus]